MLFLFFFLCRDKQCEWGESEVNIQPEGTSCITLRLVPACSTSPPTQYLVGYNTHTYNMYTYTKTHIQAHVSNLEILVLFLHGTSLYQAKYLIFSSSSAPYSFPPLQPPPLLPLSLLRCLYFFSSVYIHAFNSLPYKNRK